MARQPNPQHLLRALMAEYNFMKSKDSNRYIAQTVLCHMTQIPKMSLDDAAELCNVSVSTFLRFCKDMGYDSFTHFKNQVTREMRDFPGNFQSQSLPEPQSGEQDLLQILIAREQAALAAMEQSLDRAACARLVQQMRRAKKVFFFDIRFSTYRLELQCLLAHGGRRIYCSSDYAEQLQMVREADAESLVIVAHMNSSRDESLLQLLPEAAARGAVCAAVCEDAEFTGAQLCSTILAFKQAGPILPGELLWLYLSNLYGTQENAPGDVKI